MDAVAVKWLLVYGGLVVVDFVWARYNVACAEKRAVHGGLYAAGIIVVGGATTMGYVNDPVLLVPAALGAFTGTFLSLWWQRG
jgi:hypothetical protein